MIITNEKLFDLLPEIESNEGVSTSTQGKINKTGTCYHITSHSFNKKRIFNFETAQHRENLLFSISKHYGVRVLFSAVQPTHTHDVVLCKNIEDAMKVVKSLNFTTTSKYTTTSTTSRYFQSVVQIVFIKNQ